MKHVHTKEHNDLTRIINEIGFSVQAESPVYERFQLGTWYSAADDGPWREYQRDEWSVVLTNDDGQFLHTSPEGAQEILDKQEST